MNKDKSKNKTTKTKQSLIKFHLNKQFLLSDLLLPKLHPKPDHPF